MFPPNAAPPPPGGAPPPMPPGGAPPMPPQQGASPADQMLLQRFRSLMPQEHDALEAVSPEAAAVIMKLIPELKPVIQMVLDEEGGSEGEESSEGSYGGAPDADDGADEPDAGGALPPQRSRTALGRM